MVKRKRNNALKETDDFSFIDPSSKGLIYDEIDDFHDKEEDYDDTSDDEASKEQVLELEEYGSDDDDDDDDNNNIMENDIVSSNESNADDQNDERGMGNKKKFFFGTDLTDQRIHNASKFKNRKKGSGSTSLELEIEGARQLQERMRKEMGHGLFSGQLFSISSETNDTLPKAVKDIELNSDPFLAPSKKSKKLKSSSEKSPIMLDFEAKIDELSARLSPLMEAKKKGLLSFNSTTQYLQTRYLLCLNYLNVVSAYMMVKSSGVNMCGHPAEARLAQYKHLFVELEPCERRYDAELTDLLSDLNSGKLKVVKRTRQRRRRILAIVKAAEALKRNRPVSKLLLDGHQPNSVAEGKVDLKQERGKSGSLLLDDSFSEGEEIDKEREVEAAPVDGQTRRVITKQIAKNKGLIPSRKKEHRNPRVKYRHKYQQKLKRRKGQVREVRREIERYAGEISGIKANVIKSIKLK